MVLTTKIDAKIVAWVDKASFKKAEQTARDTGAKIDQSLKAKLELNVANTQIKLKSLRKQLRDTTLPIERKRELLIETNKTQRNLTEAKRRLNNLINTWDAGTSRLQKKFDWVGKSILNVWNAIMIAVAWFALRWLQQASRAVIKLAGDLEQAKIAFTTMLWSAEKADDLLRDLSKFAAKTPFELVGIRQNAKQLLAMGIASEDLLPTLKSLWDVSAGLSVPLERLALNYWQVIAQGKLTGRELRDFTLAGVPILEQLWQQLGKTTTQIQDMISAWQISSDLVVQAFQEMSSGTGRFADLMWQQSETLQGKWSNLKDNVNLLWERIGTALIPALSKGIDWLNNILDTSKVTNEEIQALESEVESLSREYDNWSISAEEYAKKTLEIEAALKKAREEAEWTASEIEKLEKEIKKAENAQDSSKDAITRMTLELERQKRAFWDDFKANSVFTAALNKSKKDVVDMWNKIDFLTKKLLVLKWEYRWIDMWPLAPKPQADSRKALLNTLWVIEDTSKKVEDLWPTYSGTSKEIEDTTDKIKEQEDATKEYQDTVDDFSKSITDFYDDIQKSIDDTIKKQWELEEDIKDIDKDIAERVVEIDEKLASGDITWQEALDLGRERKSAFAWLTDEEKQELKKQVKEISDFENLTEIEKLQKKKTELEKARDEEIAIEKDLNLKKQAILDNFEDYLKTKATTEAQIADWLRQKWLAVAAARAKAGASWGGVAGARANWWPVAAWSPYVVGERWPEVFVPKGSGNIIPNKSLTVNNNVNASVSGWVDIDQLANQLARKTTLAGKWIL